MANLSLTRVNQKLMQAKILLDSHKDELSQVHLDAVQEGASFHLMCAYRHYLREIAENYNLKNVVSLTTEEDLIKSFELEYKYPSEAEELRGLRKNPGSWLVQLHAYYDSLWRQPVANETRENNNLISLVDIDIVAAKVDLPQLQKWQREFAALVLRQRETSAEY